MRGAAGAEGAGEDTQRGAAQMQRAVSSPRAWYRGCFQPSGTKKEKKETLHIGAVLCPHRPGGGTQGTREPKQADAHVGACGVGTHRGAPRREPEDGGQAGGEGGRQPPG